MIIEDDIKKRISKHSKVKKKLEYYNEKWGRKEFVKRLNMKKAIWETELEPLINNVPKFKEVKKKIFSII